MGDWGQERAYRKGFPVHVDKEGYGLLSDRLSRVCMFQIDCLFK
jgi:hypothetical protein